MTHKIAKTQVGSLLVSTIELMINHGTEGRPLWFETMVFRCDENGKVTNWSEVDARRYELYDHAILGHDEMVKKYS